MMNRYIPVLLAVCAMQCAAGLAHANPTLTPTAQVMQAFLHCDARFFTAIGKHAEHLPMLRPLKRTASGITHVAVPSRVDEEIGNSVTLKPTFKVGDIAFDTFFDEVTELTSRQQTLYFWGFTSPAPLSKVLPLIQGLLPKNGQLSADGDTWARIDVFEDGTWRNVANHASLKGQPATRPERALIVQANEDEGTRVLCGLQAAPLPANELKRLRPDL